MGKTKLQMMELVSPAGNLEKLTYAWEYGGDAAYIGLKAFSLRVKADNFHDDEHLIIHDLKERYAQEGRQKRLFCALNIAFHNRDIASFLEQKDYFRQYPFDAFIVQDLGIIRVLQNEFPNTPLHLSTQANCLNAEAVRMYRDLGIRRIVLARETSLAEIAEIKQQVPDMELECFAHGAMCIAYSGRCLMSAYMTGRSANAGFCSHSCRWDYRYVEEKERPGEYFPVIEGDDFTAVFSSRDLCMIDHLDDLEKAGVDAVKIEGRMKSLYYTALTTRAYRKQLDALAGKITQTDADPYVQELYHAAHREFGTGFYYDRAEADKVTTGESKSPYRLAGTVGPRVLGTEDSWIFNSMNKITDSDELEAVGPDIVSIKLSDAELIDPDTGEKREWVCHGHPCILRTSAPIGSGFIIRTPESY